MSNIKISLIQELRNITGCGILECKSALLKSNGNLEVAVDIIRKSGKNMNDSINTQSFSEGVVLVKVSAGFSAVIEVNCETDFVAKNAEFLEFSYMLLNYAVSQKITQICEIKNKFQNVLSNLNAKFKEYIAIKHLFVLQGQFLSSYCHNKKIGVLISMKSEPKNTELAKQIAMHVAASNPQYIDPSQIDQYFLEKERKIQQEIAQKLNKPAKLLQQVVEGRLKKIIHSISLEKQKFVLQPEKTVQQVLEENSSQVLNFIRLELGKTVVNQL